MYKRRGFPASASETLKMKFIVREKITEMKIELARGGKRALGSLFW